MARASTREKHACAGSLNQTVGPQILFSPFLFLVSFQKTAWGFVVALWHKKILKTKLEWRAGIRTSDHADGLRE